MINILALIIHAIVNNIVPTFTYMRYWQTFSKTVRSNHSKESVRTLGKQDWI